MSPRRAPAAAKKLSAPMPRPKSAPVTRSRAKSPFLLAGRPTSTVRLLHRYVDGASWPDGKEEIRALLEAALKRLRDNP
jgi:hypothetical protein